MKRGKTIQRKSITGYKGEFRFGSSDDDWAWCRH